MDGSHFCTHMREKEWRFLELSSIRGPIITSRTVSAQIVLFPSPKGLESAAEAAQKCKQQGHMILETVEENVYVTSPTSRHAYSIYRFCLFHK